MIADGRHRRGRHLPAAPSAPRTRSSRPPQAGKHILCEKPLCLTARARPSSAARPCRTRGVTLDVRPQPAVPAGGRHGARRLLDSGRLGRVYEVRTTDCFHNDFDPANMGWRASTATSGGGELIDTGYHPTYLMLHLAGAVPVEATAMLSTHRLTFAEGEDSAQVVVRFDNGAVGSLVDQLGLRPRRGHRAVLRGRRARHPAQRRHPAALPLPAAGRARPSTYKPGGHLRRRDRPLRRLP